MPTDDRRVAPELLEALAPGGWATSLLDYARAGQYALDLQLRGYAGKTGHWATLYVGLTKVLDLRYTPTRGFRLDVHATYKASGWDPSWEKARKHGFDADEWHAVEDYLERVIPTVAARHLKEGAVQSAVSGFRSRDLVVIDREAVVSFANQQEKKRITAEISAPLLEAIGRGDETWWKQRPASLGAECDAVAVASDGTILAIEIKPKNASSTIPWAPVQVSHYAELFALWANTTPDAAGIIDGMVAQRAALGLGSRRPKATLPIQVRPVVAIQRGASPEVLRRLAIVRERLAQAGHHVDVRLVSLTGRLDPLPDV